MGRPLCNPIVPLERSPAQESDEKMGGLASIVVLRLKEWGDRLTAWVK
ncbi:MAG: hypothetical protein SFW36_17040 [Leptolyngbyaceae cyanobacterium bins.59]|nr:hypothetical protein [Leptolyngbyaceae cyanobacterium bins.59]